MKVIWKSDKVMKDSHEEFTRSIMKDNEHVLGLCITLKKTHLRKRCTTIIYLNTIITRVEHPVFWEFAVLFHEAISTFFVSEILKIDDLWDEIWDRLFRGRVHLISLEGQQNEVC